MNVKNSSIKSMLALLLVVSVASAAVYVFCNIADVTFDKQINQSDGVDSLIRFNGDYIEHIEIGTIGTENVELYWHHVNNFNTSTQYTSYVSISCIEGISLDDFSIMDMDNAYTLTYEDDTTLIWSCSYETAANSQTGNNHCLFALQENAYGNYMVEITTELI